MGRHHTDGESDTGWTPSSHHHNAPYVPWRHVGLGPWGGWFTPSPTGDPVSTQPFQKLSATPTRVRSTSCCCDDHTEELAEMRLHLQNQVNHRPPSCPGGALGTPLDTAGRRGVLETVKPDRLYEASGEARTSALHVPIG